jgi:membrane fusion protein (multidrug efflux system)
MATPFARTLRSLEADRARPRLVLGAAAGLLALWGGWFGFGRVAVYEVSASARLETPSAAHRVAADVAGKVVETRLSLGRACRAGDVLLVLDGAAERLALEEKQTRIQALATRRQAMARETAAEKDALEVSSRAREAALDELRAQLAEAETKARLTEDQLAVTERLRTAHAAADAEVRRQRSEAEAARASARATRAALARQDWDRLALQKDRRTRISRMEKEATDLEGDLAVEAAAARRLEYALERRTVRAPIDGRVASVREIHPGTVLAEAETVATLVPDGRPRVVAFFPARGVGRLRPGQAARVRLEGFPWMQYGRLPAEVTEVGQEPVQGLVRVELTLAPAEDGRLPLEHGAPAAVEVAVERTSPALLVLRAAGEWLTRQRAGAVATPAGEAP